MKPGVVETLLLLWLVSSSLTTHSTALDIGSSTSNSPKHVDCTLNRKLLTIKCDIFTDNVDLNDILQPYIKHSTNSPVNIEVNCPDRNSIYWNNSSFLYNVQSLKVDKCSILTKHRMLVLPDSRKLKTLELREVNSDIFDKITIGETVCLTSLTIDKSNLTSIPAFVIYMNRTQVSKLNFMRNRIEKIDCALFQGRPCEDNKCHLNLWNNQITDVPKCICDTSFVFYGVNLANNKLTNIQNLACLSQKHVSVYDNQIEELPNFKFAKVTTFDFTFNQIRFIRRETFQSAIQCVTLTVSYNQIEWIEEGSFSGLENLQFLYIDHNMLKTFEVVHTPFASIFNVDIHIKNNQLVYPPYKESNYTPSRLFTTWAGMNPYICDCNVKIFINHLRDDRRLSKIYPVKQSTIFTKSYKYITQIYVNIDKYTCDLPEPMTNRKLINLNMTECRVFDHCPEICVCNQYTGITTTYVNCSSRALTSLPQHVPIGSISLDLFNNSLTSFDARDYLYRTSSLNASHNQISEVDARAVPLLVNVTYLDIRYNQLSNLPESFEDTLFDNKASIFLSRNAWKCSCENAWLSRWLITNKHLVLNDVLLECTDESNGRHNLSDITIDQLRCSPITPSHITVSIILACVALFILFISLTGCKFRHEVRVLFHTRVRGYFMGYNSSKTYDAFISYSENDRPFVRNLVQQLEEGVNMTYKMCIHDRDFLIGSPIAENISLAINKSRAVIFIVSNHFSESEWCTFEFQAEYQTMLLQDTKLIIIKLHDLDEERLDPDLRAYFRTRSYINSTDKLFWDKLVFSLPRPL